ncbi:MAG: hypothetical protein NZ959_10740, partial [Armatimonadetes bacterium]|nr:hypothetical protein [Armatimonadota bacterium]MDW8122865.1 hypothetical protein [Armatimonadota bacterium]
VTRGWFFHINAPANEDRVAPDGCVGPFSGGRAKSFLVNRCQSPVFQEGERSLFVQRKRLRQRMDPEPLRLTFSVPFLYRL